MDTCSVIILLGERNACSNSVFSYSVDCSSSFVTSCFEEKGLQLLSNVLPCIYVHNYILQILLFIGINETKLVCSPTCLNGLCVDGVCHCEENYFGSACENCKFCVCGIDSLYTYVRTFLYI